MRGGARTPHRFMLAARLRNRKRCDSEKPKSSMPYRTQIENSTTRMNRNHFLASIVLASTAQQGK
jgi:hypothetical protein